MTRMTIAAFAIVEAMDGTSGEIVSYTQSFE